jgi:hypothetical protein
MTQKRIDTGLQPNDGLGESIKSAFDKINDNFDEIYASGVTGAITGALQDYVNSATQESYANLLAVMSSTIPEQIDIYAFDQHLASTGYVDDAISASVFSGPQGPQGPQGYTGFTGSKGNTGDLGYFGSIGSKGNTGDLGYFGSIGSKGDTGFIGSIGSKGDTGFIGSIGSKGDTGFIGSIGPTGPNYSTSANLQIGYLGVGIANPEATLGTIVASNDITAFYSSDNRLKENVETISNAIGIIEQIRGVRFDWNETAKSMYPERTYKDIGVIAQEIQKVIPEIVVTRDNGYMAVKYEKIVAILIEAIKELKQEIENLKK